MDDVFFDGKWMKLPHPEPKLCPKCHQVLPQRGECLQCKTDEMSAAAGKEHREEHKVCPICGEFLIHGRCRVCN